MINRRTFLGLAAGTVGAALLSRNAAAAAAAPSMVVYKSPTCGCCTKWVDHVKDAGYSVRAVDVDDINEIKQRFGVPADLASCHTTLVDGYVVEGHVPADVVADLLKKKPRVVGLAVPGMPRGSPGMEMGGIRDRYDVVSFTRDGKRAVFASIK